MGTNEERTAPLSVVVAGGGTAGHIEPALAIGEVLRDTYGAEVDVVLVVREELPGSAIFGKPDYQAVIDQMRANLAA